MTFSAMAHRVLFRHYQVGYKYAVVNLCVAINATHIPEMQCLVWQPVMLPEHIHAAGGSQLPVPVEI